jgi:hypothetical protein
MTKDLTKQKFGHLTVIKKAVSTPEETRRNKWICQCICGKEIITRAENLINFSTKSCGCQRAENLINNKFGKLTVVKRYLENYEKYSDVKWLCQCECGETRIVLSHHLKQKIAKDCGCATRKKYKEIYGVFFSRIKHSAKKRHLEFKITIQQIWDLFIKQNRKCALSGLELKFSSLSDSSDGTASLDRIDSRQGYITGNIQLVHKDINYMKQDLSDKEFIDYCKIIANNNK